MTAVEGERAVGPPMDDQAAGPPEQVGPVPPAGRPHDDAQDDAHDDAHDETQDGGAGSPTDGPDVTADDPGAPSADAAASPREKGAPQPAESNRDAPPTPAAPPAPARPGRRRVVLAAVLLGLLLTVGGGVVGAWVALTARPAPPAAPAAAPTGLADTVAAVAPAVLSIQSGAPDTGNVGTAMIVTPTGDVVTNEHLVHGESTATLIHADGRTDTARVVAADEAADLAWLRIDGAQGLPVVRLAGPAAVRPGDDVVAIGNALNLEGPPSVTRGIVSAVGRSTATLTDVIQTDAAISSGSSGGALVDGSGTVVAITTEALVGDPSVSVEDIAFAIPADRVTTVLREMGLVLPQR